ncbi:MAG: AMP-binding protein [Polyangiaceae bacterium]|nr:AMP-binding protein [Polyangiaceae bacterium]
MRVTRLTLTRSALHGPVERPAAVVCVHNENGLAGWGEAAPIAGFSNETFDQTWRALEQLVALFNCVTPIDLPTTPTALETDTPGQSSIVPAIFGPRLTEVENCPSAMFALETAILDLMGKVAQAPVFQILQERALKGVQAPAGKDPSAPTHPTEIPTNALLVAEGDVESFVYRAASFIEQGFDTIKVKLRSTTDEALARELTLLRALRNAAPSIQLRLDPNGRWTLDEARRRLTLLAEVSPQWVEQPVPPADLIHLGKCAVPWAADESLAIDEMVDRFSPEMGCAAFVIKPANLTIHRAIQLALLAESRGLRFTFTHFFDGPIGLAAACETALAFARSPHLVACGLHPHEGFQSSNPGNLPHHRRPSRIHSTGQPGLGLSNLPSLNCSTQLTPTSCPPPPRAAALPPNHPPERVVGGVDALDIRSLRSDELSRLALITPERSWTFGEIAAAVGALIRDEATRFAPRAGGESTPSSETFHNESTHNPVAFVAHATPEVVTLVTALASMGRPFLPIHPRLSEQERETLLNGVGPIQVLSDQTVAQMGRAALMNANASCALKPDDAHAWAPPKGQQGLGTQAPFVMVSTSGTTGKPKAAVLSRAAMIASAEASALNFGWNEGDRWLLCMPLAHVGGLSIVTRCLIARRTIVLLPKFDVHTVLDAIERHKVTILSVVPTMLAMLMEADKLGVLALPRIVLVGGAAAPSSLLEECTHRNIRALTTYGLTEMASQVTCQSPRDPKVLLRGNGAPLAGVEVVIVREDGTRAPAGEVGLIWVRGPSMFDGYLVNGGQAIDPSRTNEGFFATGDVGEIGADGQLYVYTRRSDLIVTGGENVYPAEVEDALLQIEGVRRSLVFGVADERWGQIVCAVIEGDFELEGGADRPIKMEDLAARVKRSLAPHKRPRRIGYVRELALTPSGKVDRKNAAERFEAILKPLL